MTERSMQRLYHRLVDDDDVPERPGLADGVVAAVPANAVRQVGALTLQKVGDRIVDPKTLLPWLLAAVGAPAGAIGLLVPIREAGSLLPQVGLMSWVRRFAVRKRLWVLGATGQMLAVVAMAIVAATATGVVAATGILGALVAFALARSVSSISSKDVLGRTIPRGQRGQVTGWATVASGVVAITVGVGIRVFGGDEVGAVVYAWLLGAAAVTWALAAMVFATVVEAEGEHAADEVGSGWARAVTLLREDAPFRRFVVARTLLLVSALSPPFVVALAAREAGVRFGELGPFIVAAGLASLIGGPVWGRFADRSSRLVMVAAAGAASATVILLIAALPLGSVRTWVWTYPIVYLVLALAHTGVRIGRKTYVVDLAEGDRRTEYVAVSNSTMGVLLLVAGAASAAFAAIGIEVALAFLALLGAAGVVVSLRLPEVTAADAT